MSIWIFFCLTLQIVIEPVTQWIVSDQQQSFYLLNHALFFGSVHLLALMWGKQRRGKNTLSYFLDHLARLFIFLGLYGIIYSSALWFYYREILPLHEIVAFLFAILSASVFLTTSCFLSDRPFIRTLGISFLIFGLTSEKGWGLKPFTYPFPAASESYVTQGVLFVFFANIFIILISYTSPLPTSAQRAT